MTRNHHLRGRSLSAAVALTLGLALSACAGGEPATPDVDNGNGTEGQDFGSLTVQLSWLKNTQFSGLYIAADDGYFEEAGFDGVELVSGGSNAASGTTAVITGQADVGISGPLQIAPAVLEGAEVRIIAVGQQNNAFNITSLDENPIHTPEDMIGKTIAVSDSNILVWDALLAANDIDPADVSMVPFSDTSQLTTGQVDGYLGFTTSAVYAMELQGFPATEFRLSDYGIDISGEVYVASVEMIENEPERLKAFLKALVRGWHDAYDDPDYATDKAVNEHGVDQNYDWDQQRDAMDRQGVLFITDETAANGLLSISDELIQGNIATLAMLGYDLDADTLFAPELIAEVYAENPELLDW